MKTKIENIKSLVNTLIIEILLKDLNGGTFKFNGTKINWLDGYIVSKKSPSLVIPKDKLHTHIIRIFLNSALNSGLNGDCFVGYWVSNGKVYLDISRHFSDLNEAINYGKQNEQLAIYDCSQQKDITL